MTMFRVKLRVHYDVEILVQGDTAHDAREYVETNKEYSFPVPDKKFAEVKSVKELKHAQRGC